MAPIRYLIEGLDRLGKDTLIEGILNRFGYHQVIHYVKPKALAYYTAREPAEAFRQYQEDSFRTMFAILSAPLRAKIVCNRAHLGEFVYAPLYRNYSGEYVFELEREFVANQMEDTRMVLLTEDLASSRHFIDDGNSLGSQDKRCNEQDLFLQAFKMSTLVDKRIVCVTDKASGQFRSPQSILDEVVS